jgi:phosphate starvation-inducible PhoH-like protein
MRGRSFHNAFIVADECQNSTYEQLKMLLTRVGNNSKMVLTGDLNQSDLPRYNQGGFYNMIEALDGVEGIGSSKLTSEDIIRNPIICKIISRLDSFEYNQAKK